MNTLEIKDLYVSIDDKEIIDVLLNNEAESIKALENHISTTGSETVKGRYRSLISERAGMPPDDNSKATLEDFKAELLQSILDR